MYLILSNGHSATRWITKILSKDKFSKCYHSDSLIKLNPKIKDIITYHKFLQKQNYVEKLVVGSIHIPFNLNLVEPASNIVIYSKPISKSLSVNR